MSAYQRSSPVKTYDSLVSYLENGAEVKYFFNISSCLQSASPPFKDIPVFGGEIKYFNLNKEIHTLWNVNDTAKVLWAKSGVYINIIDNISGTYCKWTEGQGSLWVKDHAEQRQLTSFPEIQTMLTSGEEVGWVVKTTECQCFKMTKDSSIHFPTSMTTIFPVAMNFIQLTTFVCVDSNNTATFITRHLDPSTF
ncbi:uncharacterized protein LOC127724898 [Mytilus californianus]|uniref:uncharacterized protein LOC127724898 n=1 Tax=Mytilus californianus TaxID=6549 RepID=UPI002247980F|nr:uncharacterized protein LOC127724898 [Mytilus californianus]